VTRLIAAAAMTVLGLVAILLPTPEPPAPGAETGLETPPISVCPVVEAGDEHSMLSVLSSINGEGRVSTFAAGNETGATEFSTGASGSVTIPADDVSAVGFTGALIEMPSETTASGVTVAGPSGFAAESCADTPSGQAVISGGSTANDGSFRLLLLNPYAGEATVELTVSTETGLESDSRFNSVIVPALSTIPIDMNAIIPERETISVTVTTTRGSVLVAGRQISAGRSAVWRAVEPGVDWWLPAPAGETKQLLITNPSASEVQYQLDFYGPDGFVESLQSGVIGGRAEVRLPLAELSPEAIGVRVIASEPVVSTLWVDSAESLAATTASQVDAPSWLLPGARGPAGGAGNVVVLNTGLEAVTVTIRSLKEQSLVRDFELAAEDVLVTGLVEADGYRIEASGPVVALWTAQTGGDGSVALGIPLQDG
jgi:Family of unknown function (DUF5719)